MEGVGVVLVQPLVTVEEIELLGPEHAGDGLAHDVGRIRGDRRRGDGLVEFVGLLQPGGQCFLKLRPERGCRGYGFLAGTGRGLGGEAQPHRRCLAGADA